MENSFSLIGMAAKGGWLMIVLAALSVAAIYIFAERLYVMNKVFKMEKSFMKDIRDYIHSGKVRSAKALCKKDGTPVAKMISRGIDKIDRPVPEIEKAMESVATLEVA